MAKKYTTDKIQLISDSTGLDVVKQDGTTILFKVNTSGYVQSQTTIVSSGTTGTMPSYGAGTWLIWSPNKKSFRAGEVDGTQWNNANVGTHSFAVGINTVASGNYSFAANSGNTSTGTYSTAIGYNTTSTQTASFACNRLTSATGMYSTAIGNTTIASGQASFSVGDTTQAIGINSVAMGQYSKAGSTSTPTFNSFAFGRYAVASGSTSFAIGEYVYAAAPDFVNDNTFVIGTGLSQTSMLTNNIENSLMVGFLTTTPMLFVDSNGIGINTTGTTSYKLNVDGDINSTGNIRINGQPISQSQWTTTGSHIYYNSGNVGIGTNSPSYPLDIVGELMRLSSTLSDNTIKYARYTGGHYSNSEEPMMGIMLASSNGVNDVRIGGGSGSANSATRIGFWLASNSATTTGQEYGRWITTGLGIGTTTPVSILEIQDGLETTGATLTLGTKETSIVVNDVLGRIDFYAPLEASLVDSRLVAASIVARAEATFISTVNSTSIDFRTGASEIATTKMTLTSGGRLGIGTTTPSYALDVIGDIEYSSQIISTVTTGTAPMVVSSTTLVSNLNVDRVDGYDVQSSNNDTSTTAIVKVGGFGLGTTGVLSSETDFNNSPYHTGLGAWLSATGMTNIPSGWGTSRNNVISFGQSSYPAQLIFKASTSANVQGMAFRTGNSSVFTTNDWCEVYHTSNSNLSTVNWTAGIGIFGTTDKVYIGYDQLAGETGMINSIDEPIAVYYSSNDLYQFGGNKGIFISGSTGNLGIGTTSPVSSLEIQYGLTTTGAVLTLGTKETSVEIDDIIGRINFYAPLESSGGDSNLVCASIAAISSSAFSSTVNRTDLIFDVANSEIASTRMIIKGSNGYVGIGTREPNSLLEVQGGTGTSGSILTLGTRETAVVANDILGRINFYAPLEASGSDSNLVAASIVAIAEATFSSTVNSTSLQFRTGASETATTKMTLTSTGNLDVTGDINIGSGKKYKINNVDLTYTDVSAAPAKFLASITSSSTPTPTGSTQENEFFVTALAAGAVFAAPAGTPSNGNTLLIRIKDNGTTRSLSWNSIYEPIGVTLPTSTTVNKYLYIGAIYNSQSSKWDVVSVVQQT